MVVELYSEGGGVVGFPDFGRPDAVVDEVGKDEVSDFEFIHGVIQLQVDRALVLSECLYKSLFCDMM